MDKEILCGAETGSGKTAAYLLPLLQILSMDPFGVFSIILAPTRELAIQVAEQVSILGSSMSVTVATVVGGLSLIDQARKLSKRPHFVVATPGRLRQLLDLPDAPPVNKVRYFVLDEADKLISMGFSDDLEAITNRLSPSKKTLLFSATITETLVETSPLALRPGYYSINLTNEVKIPSQLKQEYILTPSKIKVCYLLSFLSIILGYSFARKEDSEVFNSSEESRGSALKKKSKKRSWGNSKHAKEVTSESQNISSVIVFVETCLKCYEISAILRYFGVECSALNSLIPQSQRMRELSRFKSHQSQILVCTDIASRGLDIPTVNFVVNYDLPKVCSDYIHRIGRTARASRGGRAISFITQHDILLMKRIESFCNTQLTAAADVKKEDVSRLLLTVTQAVRSVRLDNTHSDVLEQYESRKRRKLSQRKSLREKFSDDSVP